MSYNKTGHQSRKKVLQGRLDSPPPHRQALKNQEYEGSTTGNSSTTQATYQHGKKRQLQGNSNSRERPALSLQQNIPSFITQVNKDGKPQQYFASAEENQEEEEDDEDDEAQLNRKNKKQKGFFEKLCSCLKFRKARVEVPQEVSLTDQKIQQEQEKAEEQIEQEQTRAKQVQKQRGPLQTNTPQVIKPQDQKYYGKKSLVIDLDETLVHSSFTKISNADFILNITVQNMPFVVYVKKRPGCEFFLEELSKYYELIIFTASLAEYANPVMEKIDKNKVCSFHLFRENCTLYNGIFVKDMSLMNRDLKDVIIIDNSETSFLFQPANAVHIKSYFDDPKDRELYRLIPVLIFLSNSYDVRPVSNWWREFEHNDFVDYRDRRNRLQRLDKLRMLDELGDLRQRDLQLQEAESMYQNNSQVLMNSQSYGDSAQNSPKSSAEPLHRKEMNEKMQQHAAQELQSEQNKKKIKDKKPLSIEVQEDETDNLPAARNLGNETDKELESVRNQLLASPPSPQNTSGIASSTKASGILVKSGQFKFNEFEDVKNNKKGGDDPYNFKTQPDCLAEDSDSYKEMKLIYDNIRYEQNSHNINSPVSKQRFIQLFHSNSHRKLTEKNSTTNAQQQEQEQPHFFASPKKSKQGESVPEVNEIQEQDAINGILKYSSFKAEGLEDEPVEDLSNKTCDQLEMIEKNSEDN